jgi:uncharacterized RDD family membrane protein YckC
MSDQAVASELVVLPAGVTLSTPGRRLLCALLDIGLAIVTLVIGYVIWSFFTYGKGQTPGKRLMKMRVVTLTDGMALGFWMTLLREWVIKGVLASLTFGISYLWILWDPKNQALHDKVMSTVVVDDPTDASVRTPPVAT